MDVGVEGRIGEWWDTEPDRRFLSSLCSLGFCQKTSHNLFQEYYYYIGVQFQYNAT